MKTQSVLIPKLILRNVILNYLQFTLQCILKGNKPDFHGAMASETSKALFDSFIQQLGISYDPAKIQRKFIFIVVEV